MPQRLSNVNKQYLNDYYAVDTHPTQTDRQVILKFVQNNGNDGYTMQQLVTWFCNRRALESRRRKQAAAPPPIYTPPFYSPGGSSAGRDMTLSPDASHASSMVDELDELEDSNRDFRRDARPACPSPVVAPSRPAPPQSKAVSPFALFVGKSWANAVRRGPFPDLATFDAALRHAERRAKQRAQENDQPTWSVLHENSA